MRRPHRRAFDNACGLTIVELLVTTALLTIVMGAAFAMVNPADGAFQAQPEAADQQQRLRAASDVLQRDLTNAGAGVEIGGSFGRLFDAVAPVLPYRVGDVNDDPARGIFFRRDTISVLAVPSLIAQAIVRRATWVGQQLLVDAEPNCGAASFDRLCGFAAGARVAVIDASGALDAGTVADVVGLTVLIDHTGAVASDHGDAGAVLTLIASDTYYSKADRTTGALQLMHYDGHLTDAPVADHLVALRFDYFGDPAPPALLADVDLADPHGPWTTYAPKPPAAGENCVFTFADDEHAPRLPVLPNTSGGVELDATMLTDGPWCPDAGALNRFDADLLRIRRVRVDLRFEAANATLRGPASALFRRAGTATSAARIVPDLEVRFDVSPRNLDTR
jgi:hypothetical protein